MPSNLGTMDVNLTKPPPATITMNVHITRRFRFRVWLGMVFIKIGARVMGMRARAEVSDVGEGTL